MLPSRVESRVRPPERAEAGAFLPRRKPGCDPASQKSSSPRWKRTVAAFGKRLRERPETGEGLRRPALVEAGDGRGNERLGVLRRKLRGGVVLAPRREPVAEPLQRQPVEKLRVDVGPPCVSRQRSQLGRRRELRPRPAGGGKLGTKNGWPGGKSGCRKSSARWAEAESGCASAASRQAVVASVLRPAQRSASPRWRKTSESRAALAGQAARASPGSCPARPRTPRRFGLPATGSARRSARPLRAASGHEGFCRE